MEKKKSHPEGWLFKPESVVIVFVFLEDINADCKLYDAAENHKEKTGASCCLFGKIFSSSKGLEKSAQKILEKMAENGESQTAGVTIQRQQEDAGNTHGQHLDQNRNGLIKKC